jgi:hypothetical protein
MPGFRRSPSTNQSLICATDDCTEPAKDMCLEHMAAFCSKHYAAHMKKPHPHPKGVPEKPAKS